MPACLTVNFFPRPSANASFDTPTIGSCANYPFFIGASSVVVLFP